MDKRTERANGELFLKIAAVLRLIASCPSWIQHDVPSVRVAFKLEMEKVMIPVYWDQKGPNWLRRGGEKEKRKY